MINCKAEKYRKFFNKRYMMGPNSIRLLDEILNKVPLQADSRILDLGCGTGLTSMFLARETGAGVFAVDLWCSAADNYRRFVEWGVGGNVIPLRADGNDLPFADGYFDAVVSIDSFHYFADKPNFFQEKILPLIRSGGTALIVVPGLKEEYHGREPDDLLEWIGGDMNEYKYYHSCEWWKEYMGMSENIASVEIYESENFDIAWEEWFLSNHEYSVRDREFFRSGIGRYLNFTGMIIRKH